MKCITHLSVIFLLGANAIEVDQGVETALCVLRGYGGGRHGGGMGMSHHGGSGNFTDMNRTEMLILACTENEIVCSEVSDELLANCTNFTHHHGPGGRDLLVADETSYNHEELRGARDLKRRPHGGEGRPHGDGSGRWGNLTDAEIEEMKLNHLTCKCCMDDSI